MTVSPLHMNLARSYRSSTEDIFQGTVVEGAGKGDTFDAPTWWVYIHNWAVPPHMVPHIKNKWLIKIHQSINQWKPLRSATLWQLWSMERYTWYQYWINRPKWAEASQCCRIIDAIWQISFQLVNFFEPTSHITTARIYISGKFHPACGFEKSVNASTPPTKEAEGR